MLDSHVLFNIIVLSIVLERFEARLLRDAFSWIHRNLRELVKTRWIETIAFEHSLFFIYWCRTGEGLNVWERGEKRS